ncbi:MAG: hypothetical protein J7K46_08215 [Bacteroidales bacterium]|nr:hypothetical protein [Bacteroidales bacterium]
MKGKIKFGGIIMLIFFAFAGNGSAHKFYVSLCQINYNRDSAQLQIIMKIFSDDLEKAVWQEEGKMLKLGSKNEREDSDTLLSAYLLRHFHIRIHGEEVPVHYLGKEVSYDVTWCYLESFPDQEFYKLTVENDLLTEVYPGQINLIEVLLNGRKKGLMLNHDRTTGTVNVK